MCGRQYQSDQQIHKLFVVDWWV